MTVYIKDWFFNKMKAENKCLHLFSNAVEVIGETEKAYKVMVGYCTLDGEIDGDKAMWCPKSCTITEEEFNAEQEEKEARFQDGCNAYEAMIKFAKENGVKGVRKGMKKVTILAKIRNAGLVYVA